MDLNNANKHLSTNIASNTFKKIEKQRKHKQTHTHTEQKETTPKTHTHREPKTESETRTHTHTRSNNESRLFIPQLHKNNSKLEHTNT